MEHWGAWGRGTRSSLITATSIIGTGQGAGIQGAFTGKVSRTAAPEAIVVADGRGRVWIRRGHHIWRGWRGGYWDAAPGAP